MPFSGGGDSRVHIYGDTPRHTPRQPTPHTAHPATTPQRRGGGDSRVHVYRDTPRNPGTPHTTPRTPRAHDTPHATPQGRGGGDKRVHIYGEQKHTPPHTPRATPRAHPRRYTNAARASYTCLDSPKPVQMQRGIPRATLRASHARSRGTSASRRSVLLQHVTAPTVPREGQPKIGRVRLPVRGY